jgi:transcriptional regulator with XRE-family HTH domain
MPHSTPTTGTGSTGHLPDGLIAGHLLRLIREHRGLTQEAAAETVRVDLDTWRSWETGRRPLANTSAGKLHHLIRRLRALGAPPVLLDHLQVAIEADLFVAHVLIEAGRGDPADHMLAGWVSTRAWTDLLAWTMTGTPPKALNGLIVPGQRRGPAPLRPELAAPTQALFFDSLRTTAERSGSDTPSAVLLRRQVYYMAAWDPDSRDWLARQERAELRALRRRDGWNPTWVAGRSLAVARACQGDREQLRHFIANQITDDPAEAANLNYWAYWIGEASGDATSDLFMATGDLGAWRGTTCCATSTAGLNPATPYVDLSVHTVWALLARRPWLLDDDPAVDRRPAPPHPRAARLRQPVRQARRELDQLRFLTATAKGRHDDRRRRPGHIAGFLIEAGHLKRTPRAGWPIAGVRDPESVAEHSYRTAVIAYVLAVMEGANADRAAALAVFHDVPETRSTDIPSTRQAVPADGAGGGHRRRPDRRPARSTLAERSAD